MKKILILEDEQTLGRIYEKYLSDSGFLVKLIGTLREAEQVAKDFEADLILLDHGLPDDEKDGVEAIPEIKELFPRAKIVVFSNYSVFELREKALQAGADDYWIKLDIQLKELKPKIEILLR